MNENMNFYTKGEEIANAVTHGVGTLLSIAALVLLIIFSVKYENAWYVVSYIIYGTSLIILYLQSTLYHSISNNKVKKIFRIFDHCSIYLLIAGTYTPFTLTILRGPLGWSIFGVVWGFSLIGIVMKVFFVDKYEGISTTIYIIMGWIIIIAIKKLFIMLYGAGIILLVLGGVLYTAGTIFFIKDEIPYNHAIWHLFVLGGSICHFMCIFLYLSPR